MDLNTKFKVNTWLIVALLLILLGSVFFLTKTVNQNYEQQALSDKIVQNVFQITVLRSQYLDESSADIKAQLEEALDIEDQLFSEAETFFISSAELEPLLEEIRSIAKQNRELFNQLVENIENGGDRKLIERLNNELIKRSELKVSATLALAELGRKQAGAAANNLNIAVIFLGILAGLISLTSYFLSRSIIKTMDKAKSEFVSLASHQMRTPAGIMNWNLQMLMSDKSLKLSPNQLETLDLVYKQNKRMIRLIDSLLNVSRMDLMAFSVEPQSLDLAQISKNLLLHFALQIKERELKIFEDYSLNLPQVFADRSLIEIIFQNLFSNAIKYTDKNGNIKVSLTEENGGVRICIADTGRGIPQKQHARVFSKLFRADNIRSLDVDGSGLGLYLVKSIVTYAKGKIWFESEENKGTKFFVWLPTQGMVKKEGPTKIGLPAT